MNKLKNITRLLPEKFKDEFCDKLTGLIKKRIHLFSAIVLLIYFLSMAISLVVFPGEFEKEEIPVIFLLIVGVLAVHYLVARAKNIKEVKFAAYFFIIILLYLLTKLNIIYFAQTRISVAMYLFTYFLVVFTIPWFTLEVIPIAVMHAASYSFLYFYASECFVTDSQFSAEHYVSGLIVMAMSVVFCIIIRREENKRDVENFLLIKGIEEKNDQMKTELKIAGKVHSAIIPRSISTDLVDIGVLYKPVEYMGGDYAKFHFVDKNRVIFFICDVTGHGVSAALLVNRLHIEFEQYASQGLSPAELMNQLNKFIIYDFEDTGMYLTAFACMINFKDKHMKYVNCGHPTQYLWRLSKAGLEPLKAHSTLLGISFNTETIEDETVEIDKGDRIFLFTDGVIEATDASKEEFGVDRLEKYIRSNSVMDPDMFNKALLGQLSEFHSGHFEDDIFLLNIVIK